MKDIELKSCPFCGSVAISEICNTDKEFRIFCETCPAEMRLSFMDANLDDGCIISFDEARQVMDELTELWNERSG